MSNLWIMSSGSAPSGTAEAAHVQAMTMIADGTTAPATLKKAELVVFDDGGKTLQFTYKILEGDYAGYETRQKINVFEKEPKKRDRALNMLLRLHTLCGSMPMYTTEPTTQDLAPLVGKQLGIVIRQWFKDGKEGNYISEIHPLDSEFKTVTGVVRVAQEPKSQGVDSALTRHGRTAAAEFVDSDLPF